MNKKELRNMKLLEATDELIKLAKEDVPVRDEGYYTEQLIYQRGLYLRAEVENNILKVHYQHLQDIDGIEELTFFINPTNQISQYQFDEYFKFICSENGQIRNEVYCKHIQINPFSFSMYIKENKS